MKSSKSASVQMAEPASGSDREGSDLDLLFAIFVFLVNAALCIIFIGPEVQGYGDAIRGWAQFNALFSPGLDGWGPWNQVDLRILMVAITIVELLALRLARLVDRPTCITFLALPAAAYCATKIKIEFVFFPLCLISTRLSLKKEVVVLASLVAMSLALGENNGFVIVAFRCAVQFFRRVRLRPLSVALLLGAVAFIGTQFSTLAQIFPFLADYSYTRDFANPDYSIPETALVFIASSIFSINPNIDYAFSVPSSLLVLAILFGRRAFSRETWQIGWGAAELKALLLTIVTFTSITHGFQNARYYFFYVPLLRAGRGAEGNRRLLLLSIPVTLALLSFYSVAGLFV